MLWPYAPRISQTCFDAKAHGELSPADWAAGLRPVQIWVPDTRAPGFVEACRRQARAVAADDPAGDEIMRFGASVYEWPER